MTETALSSISVAIPSIDLYADQSTVVKSRASVSDVPDAVRDVSRQYETLFLKMMLQSMREASLSEGILDNDDSAYFQQMLDQQIAQSFASQGGLGIAEIMERQLHEGTGVTVPGNAITPPTDISRVSARLSASSKTAPELTIFNKVEKSPNSLSSSYIEQSLKQYRSVMY